MNSFIPPRNVPSRDDFYMGQAFFLAAKSKDPNTQIGAVLIGADNVPLGSGYNGPPRKINDSEMSWHRPLNDADPELSKYDLVIHAEKNAIKYSQGSTIGATLYVSGKPCKDCMIDIIAAEIKKVIYFERPKTEGSMFASAKMNKADLLAEKAGVELVKFSGNLNWMRDHVKALEEMGIFSI